MAKFLTATEVAQELGVNRTTVQQWVDEGRFPGAIRTAGGHRRIPAESLEQMRSSNGKGKALLYLRVANEGDSRFLDLGLTHLTLWATERRYSVVRVVREIASGIDESRPELERVRAEVKDGHPGYEVIVVERADRLSLLGGDEFAKWSSPTVRVQVAGASCEEADAAYQRELLADLYYPLIDALALRGIPPAKIEQVVSRGLGGIVQAIEMLGDARRHGAR